jgi:hypothetical protein
MTVPINQTVGEMDLLMGAQTVSREISVVQGSIDCERPPVRIEPCDIFLLDLVGAAGLDPSAFAH